MAHTGFGLLFQIFHILSQGVCLGVALGVAGPRNAKAAVVSAQKRGQIAGMGKIGAFCAQRAAVTAQRKDILHTTRKQLIAGIRHALAVAAHADQVRQRLHPHLIFQKRGDIHTGNTACAAACTIGNADKIRVQLAHAQKGLLHFLIVFHLLRGEAFNGKNTGFLCKHLSNIHTFYTFPVPLYF